MLHRRGAAHNDHSDRYPLRGGNPADSRRRTVNGRTPTPTIDELLDRAVRAINRGDRATADALAGQVLAVDGANLDAEELLAAPD
ncbi:MAG: hypothetical protein ACRDSX_09070, partial [Mycobacterium sp.]